MALRWVLKQAALRALRLVDEKDACSVCLEGVGWECEVVEKLESNSVVVTALLTDT